MIAGVDGDVEDAAAHADFGALEGVVEVLGGVAGGYGEGGEEAEVAGIVDAAAVFEVGEVEAGGLESGLEFDEITLGSDFGNAEDIGFGSGDEFDEGFDFVYTHDLFEHLSPAGLEAAFSELLRVTGRQAWFHFFNLSTTATEHEIVPVDAYHWNLLSLERLKSLVPEGFGEVEVIDVPEFLNTQFGCSDYYNREAVTLLITRD